jgi:hypothetical protein
MAVSTTLGSLLRYLYQELLERKTQENMESLHELGITIDHLIDATEQNGDVELSMLLSDIAYVTNETLMGSASKGNSLLASIEARIETLE